MKIAMDMRQEQERTLPVDTALDVVIVSMADDDGTNKTPRFGVAFEVVVGDHEGTRHSELYFNTEAAKFRIVDLLNACSIPLLATGFDTNELIGKQLKIILAKDTYGGMERQKIRKHLRITDDSHSTTEDPLPPWAEETALPPRAEEPAKEELVPKGLKGIGEIDDRPESNE